MRIASCAPSSIVDCSAQCSRALSVKIAQCCAKAFGEAISAQVLLTNPTGFAQKLRKGCWIGHACEAKCVEPDSEQTNLAEDAETNWLPEADEPAVVQTLSSVDDDAHREKLAQMLAEALL